MKRYRLAGPAKADLDEIWSFVAHERSAVAADRIIDTITSRFPVLAGMPDAGRVRDDLGPDIRAFPAGKYLIYYRAARQGGILISRVIHGKRDQRRAWGAE